MNWYILRHSMNSKVMGSALIQVRGLHSAEIPYRDDIAKYLYEPIPGNIKVPNFKLEYRAKLTDLIKHGGISILHACYSTKDCWKYLPFFILQHKGYFPPALLIERIIRIRIIC